MKTASIQTYKKIALVGHPNVGKSVIFHALTGKYVTVSNFPGTTVDISRGLGTIGPATWEVFDSPGVMSLQAKTDDERVTRNLLLESRPDLIVQVADAKHLQKGLHLTLELAEFSIPLVLVLNMADEAADRGINIDAPRLAELLGVPVVKTVAITGEGVETLKAAIKFAAVPLVQPRYDQALQKIFDKMEKCFYPTSATWRTVAASLLARDSHAWAEATQLVIPGHLGQLEGIVKESDAFVRPLETLFFEARQSVAQEIMAEVYYIQRPGGKSLLARLGNWIMRPLPGYFAAAVTLFLMYQFVGIFGAGYLVGLLEENLFGGMIIPFCEKVIPLIIPFKIVQEVLIGPYGVISMAITYALALILPIVTTFFLFFGLLEDSGYLPRLAVMMDRFFRLIGLNGRAVLPMILGLGCDTMATVTTRILDTKREKLIISLLLTLAVPCSAQLGAILGMSAGFSVRVLFIWASVVAGTLMGIGWAAGKLLPGSRSPFLIEVPPLRVPTLLNIFKKIKARLKWYLQEVIPLFVFATFALFLLDKLKLLRVLENIFAPVVVSLLGLPKEASQAFLIGFFRRDYGAAGFFHLAKDGALTQAQVAVSMVVVTLFMPCVAHFLVTLKERGTKATILISLFVFGYALAIGGALNWLFQLFPHLV